MESKLFLSFSPHIRDDVSIPKIMWSVNIALLPALLGSLWFFGLRALWLVAVSISAAVGTEALLEKLMKKPLTIYDGSAVITGILLAFNLPAGVPLWMPAVGSVVAIGIGKQVFGGLGFNPLNPALLGRAFLMASWPVHMTTDWIPTRYGTMNGIDTVTRATPLKVYQLARDYLSAHQGVSPEQLSQAKATLTHLSQAYRNLFCGNVSGSLGETSFLLLFVGAFLLFLKGYIGWRISVSFIGTAALGAWIFGGTGRLFTGDPLFHILAGGLALGAFFMATDMVTSPVTPKGKLLFGFGCGLITILIRLVGGYPEGVSYSILLMNLIVPLLDRYTKPRRLGEVRR